MAGRWPEAARIEIAQLSAQLAEVSRALRLSERKRKTLERRVGWLEARLASVEAAVAQAKATIREYQHQLFGRHNEQGAVPGTEPESAGGGPGLVREFVAVRAVRTDIG